MRSARTDFALAFECGRVLGCWCAGLAGGRAEFVLCAFTVALRVFATEHRVSKRVDES